MKNLILLILSLAMFLPVAAQENVRPYWDCLPGPSRTPYIYTVVCDLSCSALGYRVQFHPEGHICETEDEFVDEHLFWVQCEEEARRQTENTCDDLTLEPLPGTNPPPMTVMATVSSPTSSGGSDGGKKALIAGGIAVAAVAFVKWLNPELPEGASFRPHANVGFRNGTAFTTAGLSAEWRNWRVSVASFHHGTGWARPSGRLDYRVEWAF